MGKNKWNAASGQKGDKNPISLIVLLLTFLAGAAAAFAAFLGIRASKDKKNARRAGSVGAARRDSMQEGRELNDLLRQLRSEYERRDSLERDSARSDLKVFSVQTQKIKPYRSRKRVSIKKIIGRMTAVVAAAALVVTGLYLVPYESGAPASTVQAKASFGGMKQVVEEHNEENPFVILDIVPGKAYSADKKYEFSLGTIGYLAPGQSPIQQDLVRIFKGEDKANFYSFSARKTLTESVIGSNYEGINYQEAYGGTGEDLRSSMWSQIYDPAEAASGGDGQPASYSTGELYAYVDKRPDAEGADADNLPQLSGYDYDLIWAKNDSVFGNSVISSVSSVGDVFTFAADGEGEYQVFFEGPVMGTSGYRPELLMSGSYDEVILGGNYSDATGVYVVENGVYRYASTIGEMKGIPRPEPEQPTEPQPEPEQPIDPTPKDPTPVEPEPTEPEPEEPQPQPEQPDPQPEQPDPQPEQPDPQPEQPDPQPEQPQPEQPQPEQPVPEQPTQPTNPEQQVQSVRKTAGDWHFYVEIAQLMNEGDPQPGQPDPQPEQPQPQPEQPDPQPEQPQPQPEQPDPQPEQPDPQPEQPDSQPEQPQPQPEQPEPQPEQPEQPQPEQPEQPDQQPTLDLEEGTYCIVKFTYVETEQEELLYQVKESGRFYSMEGQPRPYDTYHLQRSLSRNDLNAAADAELYATSDPIVGSFLYVGGGKGMYKLTKADSIQKVVELTGVQPLERDMEFVNLQEAAQDTQIAQEYLEISAASTSSHYIEVQNAPVYIRCTSGKDYLRKHVFNSLKAQDNASDEFAIKVNTVLAGDVTFEMVQEANLVYLEDGTGLYFDQDTPKGYIYTEEKGNADDGVGDISNEAIRGLLYGAVEESKPVIVDYGIVTNENDYADTKYQKLAKVFLKQDLAAYYNAMAKSDDLANSALMNADTDSKEYPNKKDNDYHYVNRNVYIVNGSTPLVADDFPDAMDKNAAASGFTEVLAAIRAENVVLADDEKIAEEVSKAMAVQYIINYSLGLVGEYKDLTILELQPTANPKSDLYRSANDDRKRVVLYWEREDREGGGQQILRSSKMIQTNVAISSVAAFNTGYQDINETYNMIFIGLDGQRFYHERDEEGIVVAAFNNESLKGKVYHKGDYVPGGDGLKYDENDITEQKKEALLDYLRAGYPIVVENDCFKGRSAVKADEKDINTKYIASDTEMYAFFKEAIALRKANQNENGESGIGLYTIEDVHSSAMFAMQLNALRPRIELQENGGNNGSDGLIVSDIIATERVPENPDILRGTIEYRITSDRMGEDKSYNGSLDRHLYLDLNYDGVFAPEEEFTGYQYEENGETGKISVDFNVINFGIVPWKLEVTDTNNRYRRAQTQGCFTISGSNQAKVRVLQVLDDTENRDKSFQKQFEDVENSTLAHYLGGAEALLNIKWDIEAVTPADLADRISKNANYLSLWDVVALGFGDSGNPGEAVMTAVNAFVNTGGSVIVSSAGSAADKGRVGLSAEVLGQKNDLTYGRLSIGKGVKLRYEGMKTDMFENTVSLMLDRANDGAIVRWPYEIDAKVELSNITEISAPDYLLDIGTVRNEGENMGRAYTTAWLTLTDQETADDISSGGYSVSPRDGRNNYYVYSKGNVVYVGQSMYPYYYEKGKDAPSDGDGINECKIFVNALLAAYNGGIHRANVSIVAGFNGAAKVESVTVPYDVAFKEGGDTKGGILGDTVDVYFRFTDNNIAIDKTTELSLYYRNPGAGADTTLLLPNGGINTADYTLFTSPVWAVENNRLVEVTGGIVPDKVYRIKAPLLALQNGDDERSQICVVLTNRYTRAGKSVEALSMDSVSLNRAQMFLLE